MKIPLLSLAFSVSLFTATSTFAQTTSGGPPAPDPTQIVARLTTLLTLTAAQQAEATTIYTAEIAAVAPIQTSTQTALSALKTAIKTNASATIDSLSAQLGTYSGQLTDIQSKAQAAFYAILTADQQTKFDSLRGGGFGGPGGPGGGFGGPGRGGAMRR